MKRILLIVCLFSLSKFSFAQKDEKAFAMELVAKNIKAIGLNDGDLKNCIINSTYSNQFAGTQMVYLQQSYLGLPVFNQLNVLAFKNGNLVSSTGGRIKDISEKAGLSGFPSISSETAVQKALNEKGLFTVENLKSEILSPNKFSYGKLGLSFENITSELMWVPLKDGKEIKLAWQVYVSPLKTSDYLLIQVDAQTGLILSEINLTVYCNFDHPGDHIADVDCRETHSENINNYLASPSVAGTVNYKVIPYPAESRLHPGGTPAVVTNPWNMAAGNATSLGWHNDGAGDFTNTRGNNAYVQEDRDNNNSTFGSSPESTTSPDPLNFVFTPDFTVTPTQTSPIQNQQFNLTNLFYWNNIIHDLSYLYGFDEVSGNFQNSNQGRGGLGNDYVIVDAQDGGGTNNANFGTPPDGQRPRMQMYLWGSSTLPRDGGTDNGVVSHEYGHGISNRLTGGPSAAGCLSNAEQMGEGISDYIGLMYTQNWATSNLNSGFASPRSVGNYAAGQTVNGGGIRSKKYTTNFAINNLVYKSSIPAESHDRGEIWCTVLWDMTWNIINQTGVINPNLFDPAAQGGNSIALKLVMEGMKLQPCNPGFISARNAILQADQILYGGAYSCSIKEAFRRRGMGANASEGSTDNVNDQVPDFTSQVNVVLTQNGITTIPEGQNIVYTNTVSSFCEPISNFKLVDTLPSNVTYVSGGTYNAGTRVVSFDITQAAGAVQTYSFTVKVNTGSYFPDSVLLNETVASATIPSTWSTSATPAANAWTVSSVASHSAPYSFYAKNYSTASEQKLQMVNSVALPAGSTPTLSFWHRYNTEDGWDGGVVEFSLNNVIWRDLGPYMKTGKYNNIIGDAPTSVINGLPAFSGNSGSFINTKINLASFEGKNIWLRFRFASEDNTAPSGSTAGWFVDDINIKNSPLVLLSSTLINAAGENVSSSDTVTIITQQNSCNDINITGQPIDKTGCVGGAANFVVVSQGSSPTYQWQISLNSGATFSNITGATRDSLMLTGLTSAMSGYKYRVIVTNACSNSTSAVVTLSVSTPAAITTQPSNVITCSGSNASISVVTTGSANTYQWQVSTGGSNFQDIAGATSSTLNLSGITTSMNGNTYRVIISSCANPLTSGVSVLTVNSSVTITTQPASFAVCAGSNGSIVIGITGDNTSIQWQVSNDGGTTFTNIGGATSATLPLANVTAAMNNNRYRAIVGNSCTPALNSAVAVLTVSTPAAIVNQPVNFTGCEGATATFTVTASGPANTYQWQVSTDGTTFNNIPGAVSSNFPVTNITAGMNGNKYRVIVGSCAAPINSTSATLNVNSGVTITTQPADVTGCAGTSVSFSVVTSGSNVNYQWQVSTDGGVTFNNIPGATSATYSVNNLTAGLNNNKYRVQTNNTCNNSLSNAATLTISSAAAISNQPANVTSCIGETAVFTVTTSGSVISYQWQISTDGGATFTNLTGANNAVLSLSNVTASMSGNKYKVIITSCGPNGITSDIVNLNITAATTITSQPNDVAVCPGEAATFTATASGAALTYQWQLSTDGGATFANIPNATSANLTLPTTTSSMNGNKYRLLINGTCTTNLNSSVAVLTVNSGVTITTQPANNTGCIGTNSSFGVAAGGAASYQWQLSTDGGNTFSNIAGATSSTLTLSAITASMNNNNYRVVVTGPCGTATSNPARLTVNSTPNVDATGPAEAVCQGSTITLNGTGAATYAWDNGITNGVPFAINASGSYTVTGTDNNGCVSTKTLSVEVIPSSVVTITASSTTVSEGSPVTLTASSNPASSVYTWYKDGVIIPAQTSNTLIVNANEAGNYSAKDGGNLCQGVSNVINIILQIPTFTFISPNPNNGTFTIRLSNNGVTSKDRKVVIYDSKGSRVYNKVFPVTTGAEPEVMLINIKNAVSGIYMVTIFENNKAVKTGKVYIH